ncbi:hypothetical protein D8674_005735 [Pyrus ussuriensis x Pyrus communis]|uniref:Uncharacterized protein n=1 Tax=Pyrus ussuriensis x Pyrus communis TaxID=2448454 RepID=A0A5N5FS97_9ROSA|nr:hypothetical protein D8674_005735 [Pyrus ussuriensis x Pyrus communis]
MKSVRPFSGGRNEANAKTENLLHHHVHHPPQIYNQGISSLVIRSSARHRLVFSNALWFAKDTASRVGVGLSEEMKKGMHPQMQWISYVTQSGRLMQVMMPKIHHAGKVYHLKAKRQMAEHMSQMTKFRQRYEKQIAPRDKP